jgi:hypothetical protein
VTAQHSDGPPAAAGANPYLFIVGSHRSGTTLLRRIVESHSRIAVVPETQWIPAFYKNRVGLTADGRVTPDFVPQLVAHPKFRHLGVSPGQLDRLLQGGERPAYAPCVSRIFDLCAAARGKPLAGDKTPNYVRQIHVLHALWPRARFVHLIRDGRDVALSVLSWKRKVARMAELLPTWEEDPLTTAALSWERDVRQGRDRGKILGPDHYHEVRYEALVGSPAEQTQMLCSFLGVPYEEAMLEFHQGRTRAEPGLSPKDAWLPITPGLRDWRKQMAAGEVERFEAAAGALLDELGYARGCLDPSAAAREQAARIRERFVRALAERAAAPSRGGATA